MARIDFYVLTQAGLQARQQFACRLAEKAYRLENTVHIHAGSRDAAERLDELLWTFRDGSFIPHQLLTAPGSEALPPVTIGFDDDVTIERDLLINLCDNVPQCIESFPRVAELVTADDECRQESRRRFAEYRNKGHALETHKV
jgi:DNA polymerase-3 subunit chi